MRVFKRGKIWWADYTYMGKRVRESTHTTSKRNAEQLLAKRQAEIFEGRFDIHAVKQSPQFTDYAEEYLETYSKTNKKPSSHARDKLSVKNLKDFFGKYRLNEIQPMLIEHYKRRRRADGRTPATVNRELACMKHIYTIAISNRKALTNPVKDVKLFREDNQVTNVLTPGDEKKLLAAASLHVRAIIICALETGMRRGEILGLRWENVDLKAELIQVRKTKTGKDRSIPISERLLAVLEGLNRFTEYVFTGKDGNPFGSVKTGFNAALRRAGLQGKNYRFHDLRHTAATRWILDGTDAFTVARLLGHASIRTTQRYAHPSMESMRKAVARRGAIGYDSDPPDI